MVRAPHWEQTTQQDDYTIAFHILRGELHLSDLDEGSEPFFSLLASQTTRYERITLERCGSRNFLPLQRFISSVGTSLRKLYLFAEGNRKLGPPNWISAFLKTLTLPPDRRDVPKISLSECTALEYLSINIVGPETRFYRIASILSSIVSPGFRKFVLDVALREFPDIYCSAIRNVLVDGVSRVDRPLCTLARRIVREDKGELLFILLTHNVLELAQQLTELNREGNILAGEKVIGGGHSCVYIPAETSLREVLDGKGGAACDVNDFL